MRAWQLLILAKIVAATRMLAANGSSSMAATNMFDSASGTPYIVDHSKAQAIRRWIESTDEAAARHLPLFEAALDSLTRYTQTCDIALSDACERWRYQLLRYQPRDPCGVSTALATILDLAANRLAVRALRQPRHTQCATEISSTGRQVGDYKVEAWLNTGETTRDLIRTATQLTADAHLATVKVGRFFFSGRRVSLFAPIYLSNLCVNECPYCWFRFSEEIVRRYLNVGEVVREATALAERGLSDVLLVAADYPKIITTSSLSELAQELSNQGFTVRIEVAPLTTGDYAILAKSGVQGVTLYQETYDRSLYTVYHPRGRKGAYDWRLETLDRAAEAGIKHLGLGILLGLADPVQDVARLIEHGRYLHDRFPEASLAFSLPRILHAPDGFHVPHPVDDETLIHLYCLLRLAFPTAQLVLSTRERPALRNRLVQICITRMSAGSRTFPGAYADDFPDEVAGEQFPVEDVRPVHEVKEWLCQHGFVVM